MVPAFRNIAIVDTDLSWATRESVSGQRGHDYVELIEDRQHIHIIEETAGPAMRENERQALTRCCPLIHEVDAFPCEVLETVKPLLPCAPVEIIGPEGHETLQPIQIGALLPTYAGHLVRPSRMS